jgi:hypothetical protein
MSEELEEKVMKKLFLFLLCFFPAAAGAFPQPTDSMEIITIKVGNAFFDIPAAYINDPYYRVPAERASFVLSIPCAAVDSCPQKSSRSIVSGTRPVISGYITTQSEIDLYPHTYNDLTILPLVPGVLFAADLLKAETIGVSSNDLLRKELENIKILQRKIVTPPPITWEYDVSLARLIVQDVTRPQCGTMSEEEENSYPPLKQVPYEIVMEGLQNLNTEIRKTALQKVALLTNVDKQQKSALSIRIENMIQNDSSEEIRSFAAYVLTFINNH